MAYLLDTNAWITYLKRPDSPIRVHLQSLAPSDVVLCSVVKAELWHGAEKYGNRVRRLSILTQLFAPYVSLSFNDAAAGAYALLRHQLETHGKVIGPNDLMIASIAFCNGLILVTNNINEFSRVENLTIENWLS